VPLRVFLVPMIGTGTREDPHRAKYGRDPVVVRAGAVRISRQDEAVLLIDAPQAYLDQVEAQPDVMVITTPANIDLSLTQGQVDAIKAALEARQIPAHWLNAGDTRRTVIRMVCHMAFLNQRLEGIFLRPFHEQIHAWLLGGGMVGIGGVTAPPTNQQELRAQGQLLMALTFAELPTGVQQFLIDVRDRQGWTNQELGMTAQSTVREILRAMEVQGVGWKRRLARHGMTLDSTWNQLPQTFRDELREVVESFGFDPERLSLAGSTSLRHILRVFAELFQAQSVHFAGVEV